MDRNEFTQKYGSKYDKVISQTSVDNYNKKYLFLTPYNYDSSDVVNSLSDVNKYNAKFYTRNGIETIATNEYEIDLKQYYVTKLINIEYVEFYNTWPQMHDYSTPGPTYNLTTGTYPGIPSLDYPNVYFTIAISNTESPAASGHYINYIPYAWKIPTGSYTAQEVCNLFNADFLLHATVLTYGLKMAANTVTNRIEIITTNPNVGFFINVLDICFTISPSSFLSTQWYDPTTDTPYSTQPVLTNFLSTGQYFFGLVSLPLPTFDTTTVDPNLRFGTAYNINNPMIGGDSFMFDMEEFLFLKIEPFNSTMDIAKSSQYQNFMIPNSGGRGEINQFNNNTNFNYSLVFENKIVLNKLKVTWSFFSGQLCSFYGVAPLILISYVPYETTDSRIPFLLD